MDRVRRFLVTSLLCLSLASLVACGSSSSSTSTTSPSTTTSLDTLSVSPATINGGQSTTATLTLTDPAPTGGIVVSLGASSQSVTLPTVGTVNGPVNQISIPANALTATFKIGSIPVGSTQTVQITASYASTSIVQATLIVTSANPLSVTAFTINNTSVTSGSTLVGSVTLNAPAYSPGQQVFLASSDSSVQPQNPVTVPTNTTTAMFSIYTSPLSAQKIVTVTATLNTSIISVQVTLLPTGTALTSFVVVPYTAAGGASMTGMVTVSPPAPSGGAVVAISAAFTNTATPSTTPLPVTIPATVTVPAGQSSTQFTVGSSAVTATTDVTLTATLNSTGTTFIVEIVPTLTLAGISCPSIAVTIGDAIICAVSLNIPAPNGGQTVNLTSSNPTALALPASVLIPAGASSVPLNLVGGTIGNMPVPVTMTGTLPNSSAASVTNVLTVVPVNALNLTSFNLSATVVQGGATPVGSLTGSLTIAPAGAPPGGLPISLTSSDPSVQFCTNAACTTSAQSSSVTVVQNSLTASFTMTTNAVAAQVNVTITANVNAYPLSAVLSVVPPGQVTGLTLSPTSVVGGDSAIGTVTLSAPAPQSGTTVMLQSNLTQAQLGTSITVPQGGTSGIFAITTLPVTSSVTATITASIGASSQQAPLTITPPPVDLQILFLNPVTVTTGLTSTGTVVLTQPAPPGGQLVSLTSSDSMAVTVPTTITVPAGATSATFLARAVSGITTSEAAVISGEVISSFSKSLYVLPTATGTVTEQVVLSGETNAQDFPIHEPSTGALQGTLPAGDDTGFVTNISLNTPLNSPTAYSYAFSTYAGGMSAFGQVRDVYVDSSGNVYGCGVTEDPALPTTKNAYQSTFGGGTDAFVVEFNSTGQLQYLTYLGGSGNETCNSLVVNSAGYIFIIGSETDSTAAGATNLMGTTGAFQTANAGGSDMFAAALNPMGANAAGRLLWLSFIGGSQDDFANGRLLLTSAGDLLFTGTSESTAATAALGGFPTPASQGRSPLNGVGSFGVLVELSGDGSTLLASTFFYGGTNGPNPGQLTSTSANGALIIDSADDIYLCGQTNAADLPVTTSTTSTPFQTTLNVTPGSAGMNAFVAVLLPSAVITELTYLGGTSSTAIQACKGIAVDRDRDVTVILPTDSPSYPLTTSQTLSGPTDFAVTKLTTDLSTLIFSRLIGGSGTESADDSRLQTDNLENYYFSLATNSPDFPITMSTALQPAFAGTPFGTNTNVVVVKLSADGSTVLYGSYLGGGTGTNSSTSIIYHLN